MLNRYQVPLTRLHSTETKPKSSHTGIIAGGVTSGILGFIIILVAVFCLSRRRKFKLQVESTKQNSPNELSRGSSLNLLEEDNIAINEANASTPPPQQPHFSVISQIRHIFKSPVTHGSLTPSPFNLENDGTRIVQPEPAVLPFNRRVGTGTNFSSPIPPLTLQHTNPGVTHGGRRKEHATVADYIPPHDTRNRERGTNPFQDPGTGVQETGDALYRLQQLTREVGTEFQTLANREQSGQLTGVERGRLEEIRLTTGLTIMYDLRPGRFISTRSTITSAPPPSYHSDCNSS